MKGLVGPGSWVGLPITGSYVKCLGRYLVITLLFLSLALTSEAWLLAQTNVAEPLTPLTPRQVIIRRTESFLTNPILEAYRKADQLEEDVPTNLDSPTTKTILILPVISIAKDLETVDQCLRDHPSEQSLSKAIEILKQPQYSTVEFKRIFNRYSDNIFYADSRQANLYLGGGTTPDSRQTTQYLYRNAILSAVQFLQQDLQDLRGADSASLSASSSTSDGGRSVEVADALDDLREAREALAKYLKMADQQDVQAANAVLHR